MTIAVTLVTFESRADLPACLDALFRQTQRPSEVVVVDNGSNDGSAEFARSHAVVTCVERNSQNRGFAAAQNQAIALTKSSWVLVLNPDVVLEPDFLSQLAPHLEKDASVGTLCGKLLRSERDGSPRVPATLDSAGIRFERSWRHLDRGSEEPDRGQFDEVEAVFGASGASACYRRAMIEDVSVEGEFFDEAFFAYREDADVAWRSQLLGWDCLYVPAAVGYHVRRVLPGNRSQLPASINRYSVRNRFLMRLKNADLPLVWHCGWRGVARDLAVVGGCLAFEQSSLPAFADLFRLWPRAMRHRGIVRRRRRRDGRALSRWFE